MAVASLVQYTDHVIFSDTQLIRLWCCVVEHSKAVRQKPFVSCQIWIHIHNISLVLQHYSMHSDGVPQTEPFQLLKQVSEVGWNRRCCCHGGCCHHGSRIRSLKSWSNAARNKVKQVSCTVSEWTDCSCGVLLLTKGIHIPSLLLHTPYFQIQMSLNSCWNIIAQNDDNSPCISLVTVLYGCSNAVGTSCAK